MTKEPVFFEDLFRGFLEHRSSGHHGAYRKRPSCDGLLQMHSVTRPAAPDPVLALLRGLRRAGAPVLDVASPGPVESGASALRRLPSAMGRW